MHIVAAPLVAGFAFSLSLAMPAEVDAVTSAGPGPARAPAVSAPVSTPSPPDVVVAIPFSARGALSLHARAASDAVEGGLVKAARDRGLKSTRTSLVVPVDEAARACQNDSCRVAQGKRLGARFVVLGSVDSKGLTVTVVDAGATSRAPSETVRIDGAPMVVLAQIPSALDGLLERVAPRREHLVTLAIAKLRAANLSGDHAEAARVCLELATLTAEREQSEAPSEGQSEAQSEGQSVGRRSWEWTLAAADHLVDADMIAEARAQLLRLAADPTANEDVRVDALARSLLLKESDAGVEQSLQ